MRRAGLDARGDFLQVEEGAPAGRAGDVLGAVGSQAGALQQDAAKPRDGRIRFRDGTDDGVQQPVRGQRPHLRRDVQGQSGFPALRAVAVLRHHHSQRPLEARRFQQAHQPPQGIEQPPAPQNQQPGAASRNARGGLRRSPRRSPRRGPRRDQPPQGRAVHLAGFQQHRVSLPAGKASIRKLLQGGQFPQHPVEGFGVFVGLQLQPEFLRPAGQERHRMPAAHHHRRGFLLYDQRRPRSQQRG